ncbi:hypothetical protein F5888DRAFT_1639170 [Russula emetica]|nr:hypothetical protein F5888DRAFT_1639170 [Russula emetica]
MKLQVSLTFLALRPQCPRIFELEGRGGPVTVTPATSRRGYSRYRLLRPFQASKPQATPSTMSQMSEGRTRNRCLSNNSSNSNTPDLIHSHLPNIEWKYGNKLTTAPVLDVTGITLVTSPNAVAMLDKGIGDAARLNNIRWVRTSRDIQEIVLCFHSIQVPQGSALTVLWVQELGGVQVSLKQNGINRLKISFATTIMVGISSSSHAVIHWRDIARYPPSALMSCWKRSRVMEIVHEAREGFKKRLEHFPETCEESKGL